MKSSNDQIVTKLMWQYATIMPSADKSAIEKHKKKEGRAFGKGLVNLFSEIEDSAKSMSQVAH